MFAKDRPLAQVLSFPATEAERIVILKSSGDHKLELFRTIPILAGPGTREQFLWCGLITKVLVALWQCGL